MNELTKTQQIVLECLRFVVECDALKGGFSARIGVPPLFVHDMIVHWPAMDGIADKSGVGIAIPNALNEVCNAVFFLPELWSAWFTHSYADTQTLLSAWPDYDLSLIIKTSAEDTDFWIRSGSQPGGYYEQISSEKKAKVDDAISFAARISAMLGENHPPHTPGRLTVQYWSPIQQQTYDIRFAYLDRTKQEIAVLYECPSCRHLYRTRISSREALEAMLPEWPPRHQDCHVSANTNGPAACR
jgi:hypothetical protein